MRAAVAARRGTLWRPLPVRPVVAETLAVALVLVAVVAVLWPLAVEGRLPTATDTDAFYGPRTAFMHERLAAGDVPLWAPGAFGGQPFAADAQSGVLYPPALVLAALLDPASALRGLALFHYLVAALSAYALVRLLGARRIAAVYAALAFGVSGHLLARAEMLGLLGGVAWLAAVLAAAEALHRARRARLAAAGLLASAFALSALQGSQQLTLIAALSATLWLALRGGRRAVAWGIGAGVGGIALAAVSLLPRLELMRRSTSADGVVDPAGIGSLVWGDVRAVVGPFGVSRSELTTLYAGAATLPLALLALLRRLDGAAPLAALAGLAVAWGSGLVEWLLTPLPDVQVLAAHEPVRAMALAVLAVAALAGLALDRLLRQRTLAPAVLVLGVLVALVAHPSSVVAGAYAVPLLAGAAALALAVTAGPLAGGVAVVAVLAIDLGTRIDSQRSPRDWQPEAAAFPPPAASARFLLDRQRAEGPFRIANAAPRSVLEHQLGMARSRRARALLLDMEPTRLGLEDVAGYNPIHLRTFHTYLAASNAGETVDRHLELPLRAPTPRLRALGVRYYVSPPGSQPAGLPVVYRDRLAVITRDAAALPMARVERAGQAPQAARTLTREPDRVVVQTAGGPAGRLVLADVAYPGWQVRVDGRAATPRTVDGLLRAVDLPAGRHRVEWSFSPLSIRLGLAISLLATGILVAAAAASLVRRRAVGAG